MATAFVDDKNRAGQEKLACEEGRNIACGLPKVVFTQETRSQSRQYNALSYDLAYAGSRHRAAR